MNDVGRVVRVHPVRFEVHLQSDPGGAARPFPGCEWNEIENRWEWSVSLVSTITFLASRLGFSVMVCPCVSIEGDLDVLEVRDLDG